MIKIVIPTYNRIKKLDRCLKSIQKQSYTDWEVLVIADNNDMGTYFQVIDNYNSKINPFLNDRQLYVAGSWNSYFRNFYPFEKPEAVLWLVDDIELLPNTIEKATNCLVTNFPDNDGVIGLSQECPNSPKYTYKPYGQILLGSKFIDRYKEVNYQVCCPEYSHFYQDEELWRYANSLNKFIHCKEAKLIHYHPAFLSEEMDDTHNIIRGEIIKKDKRTYIQRKKKKIIWGKSWELVNE